MAGPCDARQETIMLGSLRLTRGRAATSSSDTQRPQHARRRRRPCGGSARGSGAGGPPAARSLIDLPPVPCGASHGAGCARNQVPVTVVAMLVPLARAVFYVQTMYRRVQIVQNTCNLLTYICTCYVHIRANTFMTGRRSV